LHGLFDGGQLLVRAARVVDAAANATTDPMDIWIEDGTIACLRSTDRIPRTRPTPRDSVVIDADGRYLLPALIDAHVHLDGVRRDPRSIPAEVALQAYRASGVSAVRDLSILTPSVPARTEGIRVITADSDPNSRRDGWVKAYALPAQQLQSVLRAARAAGRPVAAHLQPNTASSLLDDDALLPDSIEHAYCLLDYEFVPDEERATAGVALEDAGIATWALAPNRASPDLARLVERLGRARTFVVPTLTVMYGMLVDERAETTFASEVGRERAAWWRERALELGWMRPLSAPRRKLRYEAIKGLADLAFRLARAGSRLVLGTDYGEPFLLPGRAVYRELQLLGRAGLSCREVLLAAVVHPRRLLGEPAIIGPGMRADMAIYDRNPLESLDALASPYGIVIGGRTGW
jgi:hypothetical protein